MSCIKVFFFVFFVITTEKTVLVPPKQAAALFCVLSNHHQPSDARLTSVFRRSVSIPHIIQCVPRLSEEYSCMIAHSNSVFYNATGTPGNHNWITKSRHVLANLFLPYFNSSSTHLCIHLIQYCCLKTLIFISLMLKSWIVWPSLRIQTLPIPDSIYSGVLTDL